MPRVNITIPVLNEEPKLAACISKIERYLGEQFRYDWELTVADNGSTDRTLDIATALARQHSHLSVVHLDLKGRGRALKYVWSRSAADVLSYMDVDLSTDLSAFAPLVEALVTGGYDVAVGSRRLRPDWTTRCWKREAISRCYNTLLRTVFHTRFSDAQCGFKALIRRAARELLPLAEDDGWFLDTEVLVLAERFGYRIYDQPVRWTEGHDSRVKIIPTAWRDLKGMARLYRNLRRGIYPGAKAGGAPAARGGTSA